MLSPKLQEIKDLQEAGEELTEEQEELTQAVGHYLEDFWYEISDGHPARLNEVDDKPVEFVRSLLKHIQDLADDAAHRMRINYEP